MIKTTGLLKEYPGTTALNRVDFNVTSGSVYGLVGPNGAGKTTLLGILAGLRTATGGSIAVETERIGVLPDPPQFDQWLTAREVVELSLVMTTQRRDHDRVAEMLELTGIEDAADRAVGGFSRGMLQRLGLAATLVADPELVLLDEPCSALDPVGRREVLDLIARLRGDATVVFSSHILTDVQEVCDTVGILRDGDLVFEGPLEGLLVGRALPRHVVRVRPPVDGIVDRLGAHSWVDMVQAIDEEHILVAARDLAVLEERLVGALAQADAHVVSILPEAPSLEDVFLEVTK